MFSLSLSLSVTCMCLSKAIRLTEQPSAIGHWMIHIFSLDCLNQFTFSKSLFLLECSMVQTRNNILVIEKDRARENEEKMKMNWIRTCFWAWLFYTVVSIQMCTACYFHWLFGCFSFTGTMMKFMQWMLSLHWISNVGSFFSETFIKYDSI